jgi:hypothetical protein
MNKITQEQKLEALQKEVDRWQRITHDGVRDGGLHDNALCHLYNFMSYYIDLESDKFEESCVHCPIAEATSDFHCRAAPYAVWSYYQYRHPGRAPFDYAVFDDESRRLAQEMLNFLEQLLQKEQAKQEQP